MGNCAHLCDVGEYEGYMIFDGRTGGGMYVPALTGVFYQRSAIKYSR